MYIRSGERACASVLLRLGVVLSASHWHGGACSNTINVSRSIVQDIMLDGIREDLSDPAVIDEFERRFQAAMRRSRQPPKAGGRRFRRRSRT
jgi:hypothetical protein